VNAAKVVSNVDVTLKAWSMAITRTDSHARECTRCFKPAMHAGTAKATGIRYNVSYEHAPTCKTADALWSAEREAMNAYRAAGGTLPTNER
jgi:hypothetical protein